MHNIILICTVHEGNGHCNSSELYQIISRLDPNIIFEERSFNTYNQCYGAQNRITLETTAIKMYLLDHQIEHIPVVDTELIKEVDSKFEFMTKHNSYRILIDNLNSLKWKYGFQFLNSDQCDELFDKMKQLEENILKDRGSDVLLHLMQCSDKSIDHYENGIIENVYRYSEMNQYDKAIMFIGSAHRKSMIQKIRARQMKGELKLNSTFLGK